MPYEKIRALDQPHSGIVIMLLVISSMLIYVKEGVFNRSTLKIKVCINQKLKCCDQRHRET